MGFQGLAASDLLDYSYVLLSRAKRELCWKW